MTLTQWMADVDEELRICEWRKSRELTARIHAAVVAERAVASVPTQAVRSAPPSTQRSRFGGTSAADLMWTVAFIAVGVATAWICWRLSTSPEGI